MLDGWVTRVSEVHIHKQAKGGYHVHYIICIREGYIYEQARGVTSSSRLILAASSSESSAVGTGSGVERLSISFFRSSSMIASRRPFSWSEIFGSAGEDEGGG